MSDGGDGGGFGDVDYHDSGFGYYGDVYPDGVGTSGVVSKSPTLAQRVEVMTGWQKFGAALGIGAVVDGVRRILTSRHKKDETPEEAHAVAGHQMLGGVEAVGGGLWVAKVLEDAGKVAARRL